MRARRSASLTQPSLPAPLASRAPLAPRCRSHSLVVVILAGGVLGVPAATGCLAQPEGLLFERPRDEDAGVPPITFLDAAPRPPSTDSGVLEQEAHALRSVDPPHGPFPGGGRAFLRGKGFGTDARVWFGSVEVPKESVVPVDPERIQVTVPPGNAGLVDVAVQNGDDASTRISLPNGYVYDAFYVTPSTGPVSGGTTVTLHGDVPGWTSATSVLVDGEPCEVLSVRTLPDAPDELECRTPSGTPGAKRVSVVTGLEREDLLDGFVYGDSEDGFRGGLSGEALEAKPEAERELRVVVLNGLTGRALDSATVVLGSDVTAAHVHRTDENGVLVVAPGSARPMVTVAAACYMPTTFVDVPVSTVTAYLDPILSPSCIANGTFTGIGSGGGGSSRSPSGIEGELVWPMTGEFQRGRWDTPPVGSESAREAAYVFELSRDPSQRFRLPAASEAVTPTTLGRTGYRYGVSTNIGSVTLYALAGIEDRSRTPPVFTAYTAGVAASVITEPGETVEDVFIEMNIPLDHAFTLDVTGPQPTARGPDRVEARVAVRLGNVGYLVLPVGTQGSLLPSTSPLPFVGLPPLVGGLAGAEYLLSASAFSGESESSPRSVLGRIATTTSGALSLSGFVEIPKVESPGRNEAWNGQDLAITTAPGGPDADLVLFEIQSGGGLSTWTVAAPGTTEHVRLPDLRALGDLGLASGPISIVVSRSRIGSFDYGSLRYGDLASRGWSAYATDVVQSHL